MKLKKKQKRRQPPPRRRSKPRRAAAPALVVYKEKQAVQLSDRQVDLIRKLCAKDATDDEFELYMQVARKSKLDPFKKEIYCVIFQKNTAKRSMVIITGIGGYRTMAARDHKDFDGTGKPEFTYWEPARMTPAGKRIPETCSMKIFAKGSLNPTVSDVRWDEYAPLNLSDDRADFWDRMPTNQLEKCCEAKGLRKRFPGLNNIFVDSEMDQARMDQTPEGRSIKIGGVKPSRNAATPTQRMLNTAVNQLTPDEIAKSKIRGDFCEKHKCLLIHCPADEHTQEEHDALWEKQRKATEASRTLEAKPISATTSSVKQEAKTEKNSKGAVGSKARTLPADCTLLNGCVHRVIYAKKKNGDPYMTIKIGNQWVTCWSRTIQTFFAVEAKVVASVCELWVTKDMTLVGIKRLDKLHFHPDGRTPIAREPGSDG